MHSSIYINIHNLGLKVTLKNRKNNSQRNYK